ncbi:MAG: hypothetical protein ABIM46_00895 [candidate division WOR-3 bacterium]
MKKYLFIAGIMAMMAGCIGGLGRGCGACVQRQIEKQTGVNLGTGMTQEEMENYRLTDADVEKYIKDFPRLAREFEELSETVERTPTKPLKGFTALAGSEKMLAELRAMGWNPPEKFFAVHYAVMTGIAYNALKAGMEEVPGDLGEYKRQMEEMLNTPNIPPEQKRQIRESLREMEQAHKRMEEQMRELERGEIKHNARVVERHMDELQKMFDSID